MRVLARRRCGAALEVTFEDGYKSWYFCMNMADYQKARATGNFPLDRTWLGFPPEG